MKRPRNFGLAGRTVDRQLTGKQPEGGYIAYRMLEHWQVPVHIDHLSILASKRQFGRYQRCTRGKDRQLQLRHPPVLRQDH